MNRLAQRFLRDESGATAIEYGLIATLIASVCIATWTVFGTTLSNAYQNVADAFGWT